MFCPKCGIELPDEAVFCPACGEKVAAKEESPVLEPVVVEKPNGKIISLPKLSVWIKLGITFTAFILGFIAWGSISGYGVSYLFSIFEGALFEVSVGMGFAKILMILALPLFPVALACDLLNMDLLANKNKIFAIAKKFGKLAYFGLYCAALFLTFVGAVFTQYVTMGFGWYLSLLVGVPGLILCFMPDLLGKFGIKD